MELQTLPIGEQSFVKLRTKNRLYVDKTEFIYRMIQDGTYYFLSRPRRFGKSLLLNTIEAFFQGQRELFSDLYIDNPTRIALDQIKSKEYALPWSLDNREKILIGLNFSTTTRRPDAWIIERQDGTISESGVKSGVESGVWPKSWPKKWPIHAEMILNAIAQDNTITSLELEAQLPIGHTTIAKLLVALQTEGYLDRVKDNTGTHWQILENK